MRPLQIKRWRNPKIDPKQALRTHIDHLAIDQQRMFVEVALQLISARSAFRETENSIPIRQPRHERKH